jgi:hypothetical protein
MTQENLDLTMRILDAVNLVSERTFLSHKPNQVATSKRGRQYLEMTKVTQSRATIADYLRNNQIEIVEDESIDEYLVCTKGIDPETYPESAFKIEFDDLTP